MNKTNTLQLLKEALAGTYVLSLNTQKCHWNVEGVHFHSLHLMFEGQYNMLIEDVDVLAERIRVLNHYAPATFKEFEKLSPVRPLEAEHPTDKEMVKFLVGEYEHLIQTLLKLFKVATAEGEDGTADIALGQSEAREKTLWMLRSILR